tara:strand:+ start:734 stop:1165 length:432 start_codon:yes stop_codon:yes gene_type:complete
MKTFKGYLGEAGPVGLQHQTSVDQDGYDTYDVTNPDVLKRVNAFVSSIADREYLIPENAIDQLRNFLQRIGITFGKVEIPESGSVTVPLTQWGGRFGKDGNVDFDEFVNDDGITNRKEGGLNLKVETEAVGKSGSWKVYAKII